MRDGAWWLIDRCADDPMLAYPLASEAELDGVTRACAASAPAVAVVADVRDQRALDGAVALAVDRFGGLDAAVAVAGVVAGGQEAWRTDDDVWHTMVSVNLEGVWRLARAAVPAMLARPEPRRGRFVAVSSAGGTVGLPRLTASAKHGVEGLVRTLAAELAPHGVTANAVAPGSTSTAMLAASARVYDLDDVSSFAAHQLGRLVDPGEVAAVLAWLCGPDSDAITGAVLAVDAGMTAT